MPSVFDDILTRAEKVAANRPLAQRLNVGSDADSVETRSAESFSVTKQMGIDLTEIFRSSESLLKRKRPNDGINKKSFLFGERGIVFEKNVAATTPAAPENWQIEEDDNAVDEMTDRVRLEAERLFLNQMVLSRPHLSINTTMNNSREAFGVVQKHSENTRRQVTGPTLDDRRAQLFADGLRKYLRSEKRKDLSKLMEHAVVESDSSESSKDMWSQMIAMVGQPCNNTDEALVAELVKRAVDYLNSCFYKYMQGYVKKNLENARRGGIPGTRGLVTAFIKCNDVTMSNIEDGVVDDHFPVWQVVYTCFRCGDLACATDALDVIAKNQRTNVMYNTLLYLKSNAKLSPELRDKLRVEWRHEQHSIRDIYRQAMYCAILGYESSLNDSMENWLWFKLMPLYLDPRITVALYSEVQKVISVDYGEKYFMANGLKDAPIYFSSLCLSGQFERAVDLLVQMNLPVDAVHMAILAHQNGLLRLTDPQIDVNHIQLLYTTPDETPSLSLARLLVAYTKSFEMTDVETTLDYFYILKGHKTAQGRDIFEAAVSRLVYLSTDIKKILGSLPAGHSARVPGIIDNYDINVNAVIARIAEDTELSGNLDQTIELLHLSREDDRALDVMTSRLAEAITRNDAALIAQLRQRAEELFSTSHYATPKYALSLSQLLDIVDLLNDCKSDKPGAVLDRLRCVKIIPLRSEEVQTYATNTKLLSKQVQSVLPDVCLAVMRCIVEGSRSEMRIIEIREVQNACQAIIMFAATCAHKFPQHIISQILAIQAKIE